ncbi:MAG: hypothetical protein JO263_02395 [Candidatus Eremiobacteraeota bacterium]|nr:hypothetical protein [Candidatus Eremiobacteraeota bacterium]
MAGKLSIPETPDAMVGNATFVGDAPIDAICDMLAGELMGVGVGEGDGVGVDVGVGDGEVCVGGSVGVRVEGSPAEVEPPPPPPPHAVRPVAMSMATAYLFTAHPRCD